MNDDDAMGARPLSLAPPAGGLDSADREVARVAKALAHPARVRILRLLLHRETCVCGSLVEELPIAQATVSQHLKVLREAGLIRGEIDGPRTRYCADRDAIRRFEDLVALLR